MKKSTRSVAIKIICVQLLVLLLTLAWAGEADEPEPGPCEIAFYRCMFDPLNFGTAEGASHCFLGYLFCKKYLDRI